MSKNLDWPYIAFFAVSMVVMIFLFRHNWNRLAKLYRTHEPPNFSRMERGSVGWVYYKSTLNVGVTSKGIYLSVFPLFSFGSPPLLIPWSAIQKIESANGLFVDRFRLYLCEPKVKIIIRKEILEPAKEYLAAQGFSR
ncbi:hypothetical protein [Anabaena sp. UHCC 0399]|uniref:hypothetical protein n=1 Tax=Anabaena sp. UHCC 0399 TaxID=3110238 RepID=UPI002B205921|nr:hypothetical protein [Anabaena sp. UHCC 0399]MEA5564032.1 hypothetical protein [Anabaena sp. UHCC 0399]